MADRKPGEGSHDAPEDAVADRAAQKDDLAYEDAGGDPEPGLYPADAIEDRKGEARAQAKPHADLGAKQGVADPEPADKPTARDAHGHKEHGFAHSEEAGEPDADEQSVPMGK
jgi:hypothetical protein